MKTRQTLRKILFLGILFSLLSVSFFVPNTYASIWDQEVNTQWYQKAKKEYHITSPAEFAGLSTIVSGVGEIQDSFLGKTIYIEEDLLINDLSFPTIGTEEYSFEGTLDGKNHFLEGVLFEDGFGLFPILKGTIKNVKIKQVTLSNYKDSFGIITNINQGTIRNCSIEEITLLPEEDIEISSFGIVSGINEGIIDQVKVHGFMEIALKNMYVGGISGINHGEIKECQNDIEITSNNDYLGGIVGKNEGFISDCLNQGNMISSGSYIGGIVGINEGGRIQYVTNTGTITGEKDSIGGLVGEMIEGTLSSSLNQGEVLGAINSSYIGGLVGKMTSSHLELCSNEANINLTSDLSTNQGKYVGGLIGYMTSSTLSNSVQKENKVQGEDYVGGVIGYLESGDVEYVLTSAITQNIEDKNCSSIANILSPNIAKFLYTFTTEDTPPTLVGSFIAKERITKEVFLLFTSLSNTKRDSWSIDQETIELSYIGAKDILPIFKTWVDVALYMERGKETNGVLRDDILKECQTKKSFTITKPEQLAWIMYQMNQNASFQNLHLQLGNDIDMSGKTYQNGQPLEWYPISDSPVNAFQGIFDGRNYAILNLVMNQNTPYTGLFGYTSEQALIQNLILEAEITGNMYVGSVVGYHWGTITNCKIKQVSIHKSSGYTGGIVGYNEGIITHSIVQRIDVVDGGYYLGGLVGMNTGKIEDCKTQNGTLQGAYYVGGIVGGNMNNITQCSNACSITSCDKGSFHGTGGIVGIHQLGQITSCYNQGNIEGSISIGGIVGYLKSGQVKTCYNIGKVQGMESIGGIVGKGSGCIEEAFNTEEITFLNTMAGGIAGTFDGTIENCYNTGIVNAKQFFAGIVGKLEKGFLRTCYVRILDEEYLPSFIVGYFNGTMENCYTLSQDLDSSNSFLYQDKTNTSEVISSSSLILSQMTCTSLEDPLFVMEGFSSSPWTIFLSKENQYYFPVLTSFLDSSIYQVRKDAMQSTSYFLFSIPTLGIESFASNQWNYQLSEILPREEIKEDLKGFLCFHLYSYSSSSTLTSFSLQATNEELCLPVNTFISCVVLDHQGKRIYVKQNKVQNENMIWELPNSCIIEEDTFITILFYLTFPEEISTFSCSVQLQGTFENQYQEIPSHPVTLSYEKEEDEIFHSLDLCDNGMIIHILEDLKQNVQGKILLYVLLEDEEGFHLALSSNEKEIYLSDLPVGKYTLTIKKYWVSLEDSYALGGQYISSFTEEVSITGKDIFKLPEEEEHSKTVLVIDQNQKRIFQEEEDIQIQFTYPIEKETLYYELYQKQNQNYEQLIEKTPVTLLSNTIFNYNNTLEKGTYRFIFYLKDAKMIYNILVV